MTEAACAICSRPIVAGSERMIVVDRDISSLTHAVCFRERERAPRKPEPESASRAEDEALQSWVEETRKELALATARAREADGEAAAHATIYRRLSRYAARALHRRLAP